MNTTLVIPMPGNEAMAASLAALAGGTVANLEIHTFPDGEVRPRLLREVCGRSVTLVCTMNQPGDKILPLLFTAAAARELGARKLGLVAPYLAYMRQDKRFQSGEAVTSRTFAALISGAFDWLATVDPHLHRIHALDEIYAIPAVALHAGPALADWVKRSVPHPFLIGPDEESRQWVAEVAERCSAPFAILEKERLGDRAIRSTAGSLDLPQAATPVLLDDMVSSGGTMLQTIRLIREISRHDPIVLAVHGVFADGTQQAIRKTGARLVTSNSIPGAEALIKVDSLLASGIADLIR